MGYSSLFYAVLMINLLLKSFMLLSKLDGLVNAWSYQDYDKYRSDNMTTSERELRWIRIYYLDCLPVAPLFSRHPGDLYPSCDRYFPVLLFAPLINKLKERKCHYRHYHCHNACLAHQFHHHFLRSHSAAESLVTGYPNIRRSFTIWLRA